MSLYSLVRIPPLSICSKAIKFSTFRSSAEKFYSILQGNSGNVEKALAAVRENLDSSCVIEVLHRCSSDQMQLGLRFFIWAGLQSTYRHSSYMYSKASELLKIKKNPRVIVDVIETYGVEGCMVSVKVFKVVLNLCREAKLADEALWVLRKMPELSVCPDTIAYNVVIQLFCEKGDLDMADKLMREIDLIGMYPDMVTYVKMIKGFCDVGRLEDASGLFKAMKERGCSPNAVMYSALLEGICRHGTMERALELLKELEAAGGNLSPNAVTYTTVIQSLCEKGQSLKALDFLDRMEANGCVPNKVLVRTLINGLCLEGHVEEAFKVTEKVSKGGSVCHGDCCGFIVISLTKLQKLEEASKLFKYILASGIKLDGMACNVLLKELCLQGRMLDGFCLYDEIEKVGHLALIDSDIHSMLLLGLCRQNHLMQATKVSKLMLERRIPLKAPYVDNLVKHLKEHGDKELEIASEKD